MEKKEKRIPLTLLRDPKLASANLIAFIVAACGGGGGSSIPTPIPTSNNAPMAGSDISISLTEDVSAGALNLSAPTDSDGDSLTISITAIPTSGSLKKADGTVLSNGDALTTSELEGLTFTPDANTNGTTYGSFSYSVSDGNGGTDTRAITFSVDAVNDAPDAGIIVTELAPTENTTALATFTATDADGDTLTYSISGGVDKDLFQIDSSTGVLTFISAPDYENPLDADTDNVYDVQVSATDPSGASTSVGYVVTVNDVNETPSALALSASTFAENAAGVTVGILSATDPDSGETFTYSISGTDKDSFELSGTTLKLKDSVSADFETDASYSITLTATDSADNTVSKDYTITVTDVNEEATLVLGNTTISENSIGGSVGTITITDPDIGSNNTLSISGTDKDSFELSGTTLKLKDSVSADFETDASYSITLTATDSDSNTVSKDYTITVNNVAEPETVSGTVVDGLVSGAIVKLLDANGNVLATTITDANGQYILEATESIGTRIVVDGGTDTATGEALTITLSASKTSKYVSAITTIIDQAGADSATVITNLGLPAGFDPATDNPLDNVAAQKVNATLVNIIAVGESLLEGAGLTDNTGDELVTAQIVLALKAGKSLSDATTVNEVLTNSAVDTVAATRVAELVTEVTASVVAANEVIADATDIAGIAKVQKLVLDDDGGVANDIATAASGTATYLAETKTEIETASVTADITGNQAPTAITLSASTFAENAAGASVGILSVTDPDSGETFTYSISGTDKDSFELSGTTLKLKDTISANFEADASYSITLTATDSADNTVSKDYTITVSDVNEEATLVLGNTTISENSTGGSVGTITITDPDIGSDNTLSISGTDKDSFELSGTTLKLKDSVSADFETDASYSITLTATDSADNAVSKDYTITVTDVNETPSALALSASTFAENAAGVTVGILSATDPDSGETFTYSISGTDKDSFELSGTTLKLKDSVSADFETDASYSITLTATDSADNTVSKDYTITVTDVNDAPSITSSSTSSVSENTSAVITLTGTDPDSDTLVYSISGGDDASLFTINSASGALSFSTAPDYETPTDSDKNNIYSIQVTATDPDGLSNNQTVSVAVTDVNETISGKLIDGYIGGATVFQDLDNDGVLDAGEPYTTTDSTGAFSLTLQSASSDTPVRVINSGFDTATNDVLTASLDISATSSGSYILTPLSTLSARMLSFDSDLYKDTAEQIVADAFGITLSDAPSTSLFGFDPIATMIGSDASLATKAQPIYTANQLLMTLGHLTSALGEHMGPTALASVQTAIQTVLDNASKSATASLTWGDKTTLKSEAHEAFMNALAEHLVQHKPGIDGFRMDPGSITLTDYLGGDSSLTNVHQLYTSHSGTTLTANLVGGTMDQTNLSNIVSASNNDGIKMSSNSITLTDYLNSDANSTNVHQLYATSSGTTLIANLVGGTMDQTNLSNIVSSDSSIGKSPLLSFILDRVPVAGESGTSSITMKLYDGSDATQDSGERLLQTTVSVNWSSDGSTVSMTLPTQSLTIDYFTTDGTLLQRTYANADPDILSVTTSDLSAPTLDLKLASFFSGTGLGSGVDLSDYITSGNYFFDVGFTGLDFLSSSDALFTKVQGAFTVAASPGVAAYAEDVVVSEGAGTASVNITLSKAAASDVTIDYQTANGTATSGDYTSTSGTLTIAAGETSGTISIPITNDTTTEAQENLTLNLSNASNATLGKSTVIVSLEDNDPVPVVDTGIGKSPVLSLTLNSIPAAGESGTSTITMKLYDGSDATQASGERLLQTSVSVNWTSDGSTVSMTLPAQSLAIDYFTTDGTLLQRTYANADPDILSVTTSGTSAPTLDIKLVSFFSGKGSSSGVDLSGYITSGNYFFDVGFTGLDFLSAADAKFTNVQGAFTVATSPGVAAYAEDVVVSEGGGTASVKITLSKAAASDVTIDYQTANGTTTSTDFTSTSGTLTIAAGDTSGTISIPITNDTTAEAQENLTLNLSNASGATLGKSAVTVSIVDNEAFLTNSTAVADVLGTTLESLQDYLTTTIKSFLNNNSLTVDGVSKTYATILSDYGSVTDLDTWIKTYTESMTSGATKSMTSFITAIDTYVTSSSSGTPTATDLATALTKVNVGIKAIDFSQILGGTLISDSGTFANSVTQSSFDSSLSGKVTSVINLAADTIGDVLGTDTATNFPNATIKILTSGDDTANGTSGSDLIASLNGADTVNALAGNDKMIGGTGVDTFDGGEGNDHIYGYTGNDSLTGGAGNDKIVGGLGNDTLIGGAGNDTLWGQTGNDMITTGAGSDDADGGLGNDAITVDGTGNKTIDGGAGTDSLTISVSGNTSLGSYAFSTSGDYLVLTDSGGNAIQYKNIETLKVGDYTYVEDTTNDNYWNSTEHSLYLYDGGGYDGIDDLSSFSASANFTVVGSSGVDYLNLNNDRSSEHTGNLIISMGDGNDSLGAAKLKNGDSIDMGAGDDSVGIMVTGSNGTPTYAALDITKLDGGAGTDTLSFGNIGTQGSTELTLTGGGATNFENIDGTGGADIIRGDSNANVLRGSGGADTIYGGSGNDSLSGSTSWSSSNDSASSRQQAANDSGNDTDDNLYGGAGDDLLIGTIGDNILDGGTGADVIYSGSGSDTIVLRVGDGGSTLAAADTIADFTDGTDFLGMDGLQYSDLTIAQSGSDTVISVGSEYLAVLTGITASNINYFDFASMATGNQTLGGTTGNDVLIGAAGVDTVTTNIGTDIVLTSSGNDAITVDGTGNKTIDGGAGTDSLTISVSGNTSLGSYAFSTSGDYLVLTDSGGNAIQYKNIETLKVGDYTYVEDTTNDNYWNSTEHSLYLYDGGGYDGIDDLSSFSASANFTVVGSSGVDYLNLNNDRSSEHTGNLIISMGDGNDSLGAAKLKNGDSIDMGAGDDSVGIMVTGSNGTPTYAALDITKLDGGAGTDTLSFGNIGTQGSTELTLTGGGATNFENIDGTGGADIIRGDSNANVLRGSGGADTIYGGSGNDSLSGSTSWSSSNDSASSRQQAANDSGNDTDDNLYGGAGDDVLIGTVGDNILDGGTGADVIYSGSGSDTVVIRSGDGSTTLANGDVVADFSDGSDVLGMASVNFDDLTIAQGSGSYASHTLISITSSGEYLVILQNITASNITALDFASTSTSSQTLSGTSGNNTLIGGAGNDTLTTGTGNDTLLASAGNDAITVDGTGNKTIDGGAGTDSLTISVSGNTSLGSYAFSTSGDYLVLTDSGGNAIQYKNIETLKVGDYTYVEDTTNDNYWNSTEHSLYLYDGGGYDGIDDLSSFSASANFTVVGSSGVDYLNLNNDRSSEHTGNLIISMGDGNDSLGAAKLKNGDSIDMGAGDDSVGIMVTGSNGTPTYAALDITKLDGGAGTDTLSFGNIGTQGSTELTLTGGGATNFENIDGTGGADIIRGDSNANVLRGSGGADTIYGGSGNDSLSGSTSWSSSNDSASSRQQAANDSMSDTDDNLYGGAGDDLLIGTIGDNILDGGTGADVIYSGSGSDTIVLRVGDGGSTLAAADTIADFTDGTDLIGLDNGLAFGDLNIQQGTDSYSNHTIIKAGSEYLAVVENMTASNLTESSFTPVDINELLANNIYSGTLDDGTLDIDFSGIRELPPRDINVESEAMDSNQLPVIEENNKIELNLEEDLSEILLKVKDPEPVSETVDNDIGYFVGTAYEEDELLFAGLEI